ncbi:MAG TPA: sodium:proton antiporter [Nitrososphaerales archaeon]|nr:sodium:proton antiporter [Nitrososphaerales archaeon]
MPAVESIIAGFLVVTVVVSIVSRRTRIPYTVMLVVLGIVLATFSASSIFGVNLIFNNLVGGGYFVALILPPLLFEAMMNIRSSELRSVINPALALATFGVVISTVVAGLALWTLAGIPLSTAFIFGALIAPTDTATVIEIFRRMRVPAKLSALLETEAGLNDATGIVLFSVVLASVTVSRPSPLAATTQFVLLLGGGAVVGLLVGFGSEVLSSLVEDSMSETIITVICVYGSYSLATYLGVSGLIAVAVAGLYFGNLTMQTTMVQKARGTVKSFWQIIAFVANSVAFLFIGLSTDVTQLVAGALAIGVAFLAVNIARAASVYPILGIFSTAKSKIPISWRNTAMLGGMKGALSIVLLASIPSSVAQRDTITTMVLGVAFLSITLQGSLLFRYADSKFPRSQKMVKKEADARLTTTLAELEEHRRMREEGIIPEDEFASWMAQKEKELAELVEDMKVTNQTEKLLRSRWRGLRSLFTRRSGKKEKGPDSARA